VHTGVEPLQATQVAPPVPQAAALVFVTQVPPSQQPFAQVAAEQLPPDDLQVPFWQVLLPVQVSHVPPPVPQALLDPPFLQVVPSQHPLGQVVAEQAGAFPQVPLLHASPPVHRLQATPFNPQATLLAPTRQVVPSQQPGQLALPHLALLLFAHAPSLQISPSQQLKSSSQLPSAGRHPPSQRPSTQRSLKHSAFFLQGM
jgi:hypothetical protein